MPKVLIPLAQGCEELEAVTLIDLLRRAEITVVTASLTDDPVTCSRGVVIMADTQLDAVMDQDFDLMALPGGLPGADNLNADSRIHQLINRLSSEGKYIGAICAAPKVLVKNGIAKGKQITAYPGALNEIDLSGVELSQETVQIDNKIITSRGPGTAMDFALSLIELLQGKDVRESVEAGLVRP